jgi:hypothetical protein
MGAEISPTQGAILPVIYTVTQFYQVLSTEETRCPVLFSPTVFKVYRWYPDLWK